MREKLTLFAVFLLMISFTGSPLQANPPLTKDRLPLHPNFHLTYIPAARFSEPTIVLLEGQSRMVPLQFSGYEAQKQVHRSLKKWPVMMGIGTMVFVLAFLLLVLREKFKTPKVS